MTKVWNTLHRPDHLVASIHASLKRWGLDYFDLVYIHFPVALAYVDPNQRWPAGWTDDGTDDGKVSYARPGPSLHETYTGMETAVQQGLMRHIGISNYNGQLILDVLCYAKIHPSVLQIEHHPYLVQQRLYFSSCQANKVSISAKKVVSQ